ncbi:MAG: hypothetical protein R2791_05650 [Saprospiraceae bacterium]
MINGFNRFPFPGKVPEIVKTVGVATSGFSFPRFKSRVEVFPAVGKTLPLLASRRQQT